MKNKKHLFHFIVSESMNKTVIDFLLKEFKINTFSELFETMFRLVNKKTNSVWLRRFEILSCFSITAL